MNKLTALVLFAAFTLGSTYAFATSEMPEGAAPISPSAPVVAEPPPGPPPVGGPGEAGPGGPPPGGPQAGPGGPGNPGERFEAADANHDGFLTKEEMMNMQKSRLDKMFADSDTNGDGKLSKEELDAGFQAMREKMRARFDQARPQGMPPQ